MQIYWQKNSKNLLFYTNMAKLTDDQLRFIIDIETTGAQGLINTLQVEISKLEKQNASFSSSLSKVNSEIAKQEKQLAKLE